MSTLYVGTYSKGENGGIFRIQFEDGVFTILGTTDVENPSYLCFAPDQKTLYAASETGTFNGEHGGAAAALKVNEDGSLTLMNMLGTQGSSPCHVCTDAARKLLFVANYSEGTATVFKLDENGALLPNPQIIRHTGSGPDVRRQEKPHVHMTLRTPDEKFCLINDLGIDTVFCYPITEDGLDAENAHKTTVPGGQGPRHAIFGKNTLYLVTEMGNQVFAYQYKDGCLCEINHLSTLPEDFEGRSIAAAIKLSPDGKTLAASNRGHDSIALFHVEENGALTRTGIYPCLGQGPRDIAFTPDGKYLLVANQNSSDITVLAFDAENGTLEKTDARLELPRPVGLLFK